MNPTIKAYFSKLGQKGGRSRSPRKARASRANGAKRKAKAMSPIDNNVANGQNLVNDNPSPLGLSSS